MKLSVIVIIILLITLPLHAQTIYGRVIDRLQKPIAGVSIFLKGSYDGASSNIDGNYSFQSHKRGTQELVFSRLGYVSTIVSIDISSNTEINQNIILTENRTKLREVTITAGLYEAGDNKRGIQLQALDIFTTANTNGDIFGALNTMPGTQMAGEEGALFVRGGEKNESKTYIDGLLASNPYTSKVPDLPARGRFTPSLFSGVSFSSGGYSAEYGQALSSALILQTQAFPTKNITSISAYPFGAGINRTWKGDSTAFSCSLDYHNFKPYYSVVQQNVQWLHSPEGLQSNLIYRKKFGKNGFIRSFGSFSLSKLGLLLKKEQAIDGNTSFNMGSNDIYLNTVYTNTFSNDWSFKTGVSLNNNNENIGFEHFNVSTQNRVIQVKATIQKQIRRTLSVKSGLEFNYQNYQQSFQIPDSVNYSATFTSPLSAAFIEAEWQIGDRLFSRLGNRFEYSNLLHESSLAPRVSMAYTFGKGGQISAAYGLFGQLPKSDYLKFHPKIKSEHAVHYILNYQYSTDRRMFRVEGFSKEYSQLVCYTSQEYYRQSNFSNNGYGYARGMEIFVRDRKTLHNGDYWISYSYLDTRKLYQDFTTSIRPYLFSKHNLSVVGKYYVPALTTQFAATYQFASGRPYYNPYTGNSLQDQTPAYHNLSTNFSYLTNLWGCFTVIHVSVSNILGFEQIFGYRYNHLPNSDGTYTANAIKPASQRFILLGIFVTLNKGNSQF